jgi:tetratricopeptide (TPR) repeat protein
MLDRFVRFLQARRAFSDGRFEELFRLLEDPLVSGDRRAADLRRDALARVTERAARRLEQGDAGAALSDLRWVLAKEPAHERASALRETAESALREVKARDGVRDRLLATIRSAIEQGRLAEAGRLLETAADLTTSPESAELRALLRQRGDAAQQAFAQARASLLAGKVEEAAQEAQRARALCVDLPGITEFETEVLQARYHDLLTQARELAERDRPGEGLTLLQPHLLSHPGLEHLDQVVLLRRQCAAELAAKVQGVLVERGPQEAELELRGADPGVRAEPEIVILASHLQALRRAVELETHGEFAAAGACYQSLFRKTGWPEAEAAATRSSAAERRSRELMERAQACLRRGDLAAARTGFDAVLAEWPEHRGAREQCASLVRSLDRESETLAQCRGLVADGQLLAARESVYRLVAGGPFVEDARSLLRDIESRCRRVEDGVAQIQAAVAARAGMPSAEALQSLLDRAQELRALQADAPTVTDLIAALERELQSCLRCQRIRDAAQRLDVAVLLAQLREESESAGAFLRAERVARDRDLAAEIVAEAAERLLAGGQLQEAEAVSAQVLGLLSEDATRLRGRVEGLIALAGERKGRSQDLARTGLAALARGDVRAAQEAALEATALHPRADDVLRLREALAKVRQSTEQVAKVERMLDDKDLDGAHRQIRNLGPTPEPLKSRVFELRRRLDQLEGLHGDFVLRVEEAGEYLVLRGSRVVLGNARHGQCDLPILANLQPRHAEIRRKVSFHGGHSDVLAALTDRVVSVDGAPVREHALKHGHRIRLGDVLELTYLVPCSRSRSILLRLGRGFQVDGVEKVILMTDRSKDGRVVLANRSDAHVRVGAPGVEVELYADSAGALRVLFQGDGEVDGRPFRGESPVPAGSLVRCGPIVFSAHPRPPVAGIEVRTQPSS